MAMKKGGLGRGLDALFNENATDRNELIELNILDIEPNHEQPRKVFDQNALEELANSIKEHGLLQPIVVKPVANGTYRIIAGERRWRASRLAGLKTVPVIVKDFAEQQVMEAALIENLQRQDLNAVEEALGYKALIDTYGLTQDEVAKRVGKSRVAVTQIEEAVLASGMTLLFVEHDETFSSRVATQTVELTAVPPSTCASRQAEPAPTCASRQAEPAPTCASRQAEPAPICASRAF